MDKQINGWIDRQMEGLMSELTNRLIHEWIYVQSDKWMDRQISGPKSRWADR